jgi:hypothetical protein
MMDQKIKTQFEHVRASSLVSIHKWPISPISALREKFNPRNINPMPAVKFFESLDLDPICLFLDGHALNGLSSARGRLTRQEVAAGRWKCHAFRIGDGRARTA